MSSLTENNNDNNNVSGSLPVAILRVTLGVIILVTWFGNVKDDKYTADGMRGLLDWLSKPAEEGGNGGSLGWFHSLLDSVVAPNAGLFGGMQLVVELLFGIGLLLGLFTRVSSLLAIGFFATLLLSYFGGHEWIWTYVLLIASTLTVFLGYGGRKFGIDQVLSKKMRSPLGLVW